VLSLRRVYTISWQYTANRLRATCSAGPPRQAVAAAVDYF